MWQGHLKSYIIISICNVLLFTGYMWHHMCGINMATDNLCGVCGDGSDSYSYNKYTIF